MSRLTGFGKLKLVIIPIMILVSIFFVDDVGAWVLADVFGQVPDSWVLNFLVGAVAVYFLIGPVLTIIAWLLLVIFAVIFNALK